MKAGKIGIVTVTYNSAPVLEEFLASLECQTYPDLTVYAIDNASSDGTPARLAGCDERRYRVIRNGANLGVAAANNQGIRAALADGCDSVLLLNNDTIFGAGLVGALARGMEQENCHMVTPRIFYHDPGDVIWAAGGHFQSWAGHRIRHRGKDRRSGESLARPAVVTYAPTCCLLMAREVFEQVGYMDERYFVYLDDVDFLFRAYKVGMRLCYLPVDLWHKVSSLTGEDSPFSVHFIARNRGYFIRKHVRAWLQPCVAAGQIGYYALRLLAGEDSPATAILRMRSFLSGLAMHPEAAS